MIAQRSLLQNMTAFARPVWWKYKRFFCFMFMVDLGLLVYEAYLASQPQVPRSQIGVVEAAYGIASLFTTLPTSGILACGLPSLLNAEVGVLPRTIFTLPLRSRDLFISPILISFFVYTCLWFAHNAISQTQAEPTILIFGLTSLLLNHVLWMISTKIPWFGFLGFALSIPSYIGFCIGKGTAFTRSDATTEPIYGMLVMVGLFTIGTLLDVRTLFVRTAQKNSLKELLNRSWPRFYRQDNKHFVDNVAAQFWFNSKCFPLILPFSLSLFGFAVVMALELSLNSGTSKYGDILPHGPMFLTSPWSGVLALIAFIVVITYIGSGGVLPLYDRPMRLYWLNQHFVRPITTHDLVYSRLRVILQKQLINSLLFCGLEFLIPVTALGTDKHPICGLEYLTKHFTYHTIGVTCYGLITITALLLSFTVSSGPIYFISKKWTFAFTGIGYLLFNVMNFYGMSAMKCKQVRAPVIGFPRWDYILEPADPSAYNSYITLLLTIGIVMIAVKAALGIRTYIILTSRRLFTKRTLFLTVVAWFGATALMIGGYLLAFPNGAIFWGRVAILTILVMPFSRIMMQFANWDEARHA